MVWKASKAQIINTKEMTKYTVLVVLILYLYEALMISLKAYFEVGNFVRFCANLSGTNELQFLRPFKFLILFAAICTGLYFDVKMIKFIKNRNRITPAQPAQLIPWRTQSPNKTLNNVPVRATILSTLSLIILCIFGVPVLHSLHYQNVRVQWDRLLTFMIWLSLQLPMILIFTIKHKEHSNNLIKRNQPPRKLHFHDENGENGENGENCACANPVNQNLEEIRPKLGNSAIFFTKNSVRILET